MAAIENNKETKVTENAEDISYIHLFPDRESMIAELAYYKAEKRGFLPGCELDDWFEAEKELGF